jgi:hypothetical protein
MSAAPRSDFGEPGSVDVIEKDTLRGVSACRVILSDGSAAYDVRIDIDDQHVVIDACHEEHALHIYEALTRFTDVRGW